MGHCIVVDPYYLVHKAEELGYKPNLILGARQINNGMGKYIADQTIKTMISCDKKINKSNVLILGITFKEDCPDLRNSRVFDIIDELESYGCIVDIHDPWINEKNNNIDSKYKIINNPFRNIKKYDSIIVAVAHKEFRNLKYNDYKDISSYKPVIMDIKGIVDNPNWRL